VVAVIDTLGEAIVVFAQALFVSWVFFVIGKCLVSVYLLMVGRHRQKHRQIHSPLAQRQYVRSFLHDTTPERHQKLATDVDAGDLIDLSNLEQQ
jgi:hypothetical protein